MASNSPLRANCWFLATKNSLLHATRCLAPTNTLRLAVGLVLLFASAQLAQCSLFYPVGGSVESVPAIQLWYSGYWKHPGWMNGTMVKDDAEDKRGKLVLVVDKPAPYDKHIAASVKAGAIGVVFLRHRSGTPGQTMYLVRMGSDQRRFTIPVVEVFQLVATAPNSLARLTGPQGLPVSIWPDVNKWKIANEHAWVQIIFNVVNSLLAVIIISIGIYRLNQWWGEPGSVWISIGSVCIIMEVCSGILRFALCCVDPFWSFRVLDDTVANVLTTGHLPFTFCSGILLTFFWAETLNANKVHVSPFISDYKRAAITVCVLLFVVEISTGIARTFTAVTSFNPSFVSEAFYVVTSLTLTVSYIWCAVKIQQKTADLSGRKRKIRNMTFRFAGSTGGYIVFCILVILLLPFTSNPWGFKILLNLIALASNWWGLLQVYSFVPPRLSRGRTTGNSSAENHGASVNVLNSIRSDYSRTGMPQTPIHEEDIETTTSTSTSASSSDTEGLLDSEKEHHEDDRATQPAFQIPITTFSTPTQSSEIPSP